MPTTGSPTQQPQPTASQAELASAQSSPQSAWRPQSKRQIFLAFSSLALQGFGGVLTVVQRDLVEKKRWMTPEEFVEDWTVAQILPGPNVVNLALILGDRYFGISGALAALAGLFALPLLLVLSLTLAYQQFLDVAAVSGALKGMGAVAAGLIMATGGKLIASLKKNPMGLLACIVLMLATFGSVALLHWPLVTVLLCIGGPAYAWAWFQLRRIDMRRATSESPQNNAPGNANKGDGSHE